MREGKLKNPEYTYARYCTGIMVGCFIMHMYLYRELILKYWLLLLCHSTSNMYIQYAYTCIVQVHTCKAASGKCRGFPAPASALDYH